MRAHNIQRAHCTHMHADARASHLYPHTRGCASLVSRGARNTLVTFPRGDDVIPVGTRRDALTRGKNPADTPPKQTRRTLRGFPASYCLPMLLNILYAGRESSINRELQVSTTSFWWTGYRNVEDGGLIDLFGTYVRNFVSLETDARTYNWTTYGSLYLNVK